MIPDFSDLIQERRYEELETRWLESMEAGSSSVRDFLNAARLLGRQKEKERAGLLLGLLAQHFLEKQNWKDRLRVLIEIAKHTPDGKLEDLKFNLEDAFKHVYAGSPSLTRIFRHFNFYDISSLDDLRARLDPMERWLSRDVGKPFYQEGYGAGRVKEINLNLGLVRIDFEKKKDVTFEIGDTSLFPLEEGHVLREKLDHPESLRQKALTDSADVLQRLFADLGRPLTINEIKENLSGIIHADEWTKWWNAAKKNPQIVVSGKGVAATYSWMDSIGEAEQAVKERFQSGDLRARMDVAKQHSFRNPELAAFFRSELEADARKLYESEKYGLLLELLDLFERWPAGQAPDAGFSFSDISAKVDPVELLRQTENINLRLRLLQHHRETSRDSWPEIFSAWLLKEESPRILTFLAEALQKAEPESVRAVIDGVIARPYSAPATFTWLAESAVDEDFTLAGSNNGALLVAVFTQIEEPEFNSFRNRLKKAVESGLLLNLLNRGMDEDAAKKALDLLDRADAIEDYRRARWKSAILMRFPQMKKKEDFLFSTHEAIERKRAELEQLVQVELPQNRKAIGEAAAHGDLRENHEYKAARERQEYLINRVQQLQTDLVKARVIEPGKTDASEVRPGTCVVLRSSDGETMNVTLLGPWDSNPANAVYSYQSPIGESLLGRRAGESATINDRVWIIDRIEPWNV